MTTTSSVCIYRVLDGDVQEFVLMEVSRRAVNEMFDITEKLLAEAAAQGKNIRQPVLIDSQIGLQPINHIIMRMRILVNIFPARRTSRVALIISPNPLSKTIAVLMRPFAPVRLYTPEERDQALAWLRAPIEQSAAAH
jgi:hypothetical protein